MRDSYEDDNLKVNEFLHRRVEIEDVVDAHILALKKATDLGFQKYIISATTPFKSDDLMGLHTDAPSIVRDRVPDYEAEYRRHGWKMFPCIGRVYVNEKARRELGWKPRYDFKHLIELLSSGKDLKSSMALKIGSKGYHSQFFSQGPYPTE
jgi:UDP-glucose 4-epimerase